MTQEQDAANWQILNQYKLLRAEKTQREKLAGSWGHFLVSVGNPLSSCGGILHSLDLSRLPEKSELLEAQRELRVLNDQVAFLREQLRRAGMADLI